jgi:hypothetical protein
MSRTFLVLMLTGLASALAALFVWEPWKTECERSVAAECERKWEPHSILVSECITLTERRCSQPGE